MTAFKSVFAKRLSQYVTLRRKFGFKFDEQTSILREFDHYLADRGYDGDINEQLALEFANRNEATCQNRRAQRYQVVRHFTDYLAIFVPGAPQLDPNVLKRKRSHYPAYIYTDEELDILLREARRISPRHPFRGLTLHAMVGLAACTGLRLGEVIALDKADVNFETRVLDIRGSKFGKDRLVPVHPTTCEILRSYAAVRDVTFVGREFTAFFLNLRGRRPSPVTVGAWFVELTRRAGLRGAKDSKGPRFHDLRHRFAVRRVVTWFQAGEDVQAMLPALATYMGHTHYSQTAYYLASTAEVLGLAAERFDRAIATSREAES